MTKWYKNVQIIFKLTIFSGIFLNCTKLLHIMCLLKFIKILYFCIINSLFQNFGIKLGCAAKGRGDWLGANYRTDRGNIAIKFDCHQQICLKTSNIPNQKF